jgi:hypothetical protein
MSDVSGTKLARDTVFYASILVVFVLLLYDSRGLSDDSRLFPLIILVTGILLLLVRLGLNTFEYASRSDDADEAVTDRSETTTSSGSNENPADENVAQTEQELQAMMRSEGESADIRFQLRMVAWVIAFGAGLYLFGVITMIPILMFAFLLVEADIALWKKVVISISVWGIMYVLFIVILSVRMHEGVVGIP